MTSVFAQPLLPTGTTNPDAWQAASPRYWLCPHVYLCATQSGVVFLDTRRDRYFGLCGLQLRALSRVVEGWPSQPHLIDPTEPVSPQDVLETAEQYVTARLITLDSALGKPATSVNLDVGGDLIAIGTDVRRNRSVRLRDLVRFLAAYALAARALRRTSLEFIVEQMTERKNRALLSGRDIFSPDMATELVCVFRRLRSFIVFGKDRCLLQALTLIHFLAQYGQFPTLVIGVRTDPWGAHSWVQHDHLVLDATPEIIRFYTPILTI